MIEIKGPIGHVTEEASNGHNTDVLLNAKLKNLLDVFKQKGSIF